MNDKIEEPRIAQRLFLLCWMVYFSAYLGRLNYSSAMTVMIRDLIITKSQAGFISMIYFFAYGIGQLINGFIGDRLNSKKMITYGLTVSAIMNLLMSLSRNFLVMSIVWCINGYAQSMIWPPIIRIFSERLEMKSKLKYSVDIASSQPAGTLASYLLSVAILSFFNWQYVFFAAGILLLIVVFIWNSGYRTIEKYLGILDGKMKENDTDGFEKSTANAPKQMNFKGLICGSGILMFVIPIFVHGILKDGVVSWVPTYISETFHVDASISILLTTLIPLINLSGAYMGRYIFIKMKNDEVKAAIFFFAVAVSMLSVLYLFGNRYIILTALILSVITASMMAINTLLISLYPLRFEKQGRVATVSGFLNAMAYLGTALSTFTIGILVQNKGWNGTILSWIFVTIIALITCVMRYRKTQNEQFLTTQNK